MKYQMDRTWMEISLDAIEENYRALCELAGDNAGVMAVFKANAYGLGAPHIARFLEECGCRSFAVACIEEAMELRESGIRSPILTLGPIPAEYVTLAADNSIESPVISLAQAEKLSAEARKTGCTLRVHIKADTGLSRFGILLAGRLDEAVDEAEEISKLDGLEPVGVFTHFIAPDEKDGDEMNQSHLALFHAFTDRLEERGLKLKRHCASSVFAYLYPESFDDFLRVAGALLGLDSPMEDALMEPVLSTQMKTRILQIKEVPAGTPVSYGPIYYTKRRTKIAVVPVGFADGIHRCVSNRGDMLLHGRRVRIIGKLCMDFCMLDITDVPEAEEGDVVTVFGEDEGAILPIYEYSHLYPGSVGEVTTVINPRVPRFYTRDGRIVGRWDK